MGQPLPMLTTADDRRRASPYRRLADAMAVVILLLAGALANASSPATSPQDSDTTSNTLVRLHEGDHDWLLVSDAHTDEVTVYDIRDGRPLRRLAPGQMEKVYAGVTGKSTGM
jgi:hypothetical protein